MSTSERDVNKQDKEKRLQEAIERWNIFFTKQIDVAIVGNSCSVDCNKAIHMMKDMHSRTNVSKAYPDIAFDIRLFFETIADIYPIRLGISKIDTMGYSIKSFGPIIEGYSAVNSRIPGDVSHFTGERMLMSPDTTITTFRPYPSGFLCIVEKLSPNP